MILVTLGTQDKKFPRLLEAVQEQIDLGNIKDRVVVQAGSTHFESKDMEIFDMIPMNKFEELINDCDILITHGGVGSIINGLKKEKKIIAAARLSKYNEHVNDHQLQIIDNFVKEKYILSLDNFSNLDAKLKEIKKFKPRKYTSNNLLFVEKLKHEIDNFLI